MTLSALALGGLLFAIPHPNDIVMDSCGAALAQAVADSVTESERIPTPYTSNERESSRSVPARMGRAIRNFGSDAWHVVSSPARMNGRGLLATAAVLGATAALYANDQEIYDATQRNLDDPVYRPFAKAGEFIRPIGFMPNAFAAEAGAWAIGQWAGAKPLRQIPEELAESHLITGGIRNVVRSFVHRQPPREGAGPRAFESGRSFYSGHTSVEFEIATIVSHHAHSTPVTVLMFSLAAIGALDRFSSGAHWPSDVLLPAVTGTLIAHTVYQRNEQRRTRPPTAPRWSPTVRRIEDTIGYGISWGF